MVFSIEDEERKLDTKSKDEAYREYKYDSTTNQKLYDTRLYHKKKGRDFPEDYIDVWKKDPEERAFRIWTFWKDKTIDYSEFIFYQIFFNLLYLHNYQVMLLRNYYLI